MRHAAKTEIVLKLDQPSARVWHGGTDHLVHAVPVDRVGGYDGGAGTGFAAAYLAGRLRGDTPAARRPCGPRFGRAGGGASWCHHAAGRYEGIQPMTTAPRDRLAALLALGRVHSRHHHQPAGGCGASRPGIGGGRGCACWRSPLRTPAGLPGAEAIIRAVPDAVVGIGTRADTSGYAPHGGDWRAIRTQPRRHAGAAGRAAAGVGPSLHAGDRDGVGTDGGAGARVRHGEVLFPPPRRAGCRGLRALAGPFPHARFCPTGGITEENAAEWLGPAKCGGRWRIVADAGE